MRWQGSTLPAVATSGEPEVWRNCCRSCESGVHHQKAPRNNSRSGESGTGAPARPEPEVQPPMTAAANQPANSTVAAASKMVWFHVMRAKGAQLL